MTDWEDYDSGPFCRHWADPADCEEPCVCGHPCHRHVWGECDEEGCACEEFQDVEAEPIKEPPCEHRYIRAFVTYKGDTPVETGTSCAVCGEVLSKGRME